ncbi:MAG: ABC transporter permease [Hyphomicrobiaceae bacterium]
MLDKIHNFRPEIVNRVQDKDFGVIERPLGTMEKLLGNNAVRKTAILVVLGLIWEVYARALNNDLLVPTLGASLVALYGSLVSGELIKAIWYTLKLLLQGYVIGLFLAMVLTIIASATRIGADFLETLTAMFNPLPSIALLPLAMVWFGLGDLSIVFVLIHAVLWSVALNTFIGFRAVSTTWRMVGQNYGLSNLRLVLRILIPGAFPNILAGLKIGWAFSWRTVIAAELVFGSSSGQGGVGWYIYQNKNLLEIPHVFAGLLTVILFGFFVENVVFRTIERRTVVRWGMQT